MASEDTYLTIASPAEEGSRERSSKFLAFAYPVESEAEIKGHLEVLKKRYYDATHHCYAWRMGYDGLQSRSNDDGEPSGTAGRPILGQILSAGLTNVLVVVVRYFGGTKLGVPGLIKAYKEAAEGVLALSRIEERTVETIIEAGFPFERIGQAMKVVKETQARVVEQSMDNMCRMTLAIRRSQAGNLQGKLEKGGISVEVKKQ